MIFIFSWFASTVYIFLVLKARVHLYDIFECNLLKKYLYMCLKLQNDAANWTNFIKETLPIVFAEVCPWNSYDEIVCIIVYL